MHIFFIPNKFKKHSFYKNNTSHNLLFSVKESSCADKETQTDPADFKLVNGQTIPILDKNNLKPEEKKQNGKKQETKEPNNKKPEEKRLKDDEKDKETNKTRCNNVTNHERVSVPAPNDRTERL